MSKYFWFVNCVKCGGQIRYLEAFPETEPFPETQRWKVRCPHCDEEHTYKAREMLLGEK